MIDTASPDLSKALGRAAKIFRQLEEAGMTNRGWQRLQDDPEIRRQVVDLCDPVVFLDLSQLDEPVFLDILLRSLFSRSGSSKFFEGDRPDFIQLYLWFEVLSSQETDIIIRTFNMDRSDWKLHDVAKHHRMGLVAIRSLADEAIDKLKRRNKTLVFQVLRERFPADLLATPIEYLDFSERTYNCLLRAGLDTVEQVIEWEEEQFLNITNFGYECLDEVKATLAELGMSLP